MDRFRRFPCGEVEGCPIKWSSIIGGFELDIQFAWIDVAARARRELQVCTYNDGPGRDLDITEMHGRTLVATPGRRFTVTHKIKSACIEVDVSVLRFLTIRIHVSDLDQLKTYCFI